MTDPTPMASAAEAPAFRPPLSKPSFYAGDPFPTFARLREAPTLHRHQDPDFWAVSRHEDVVAVSRNPETFCSSQGTLLSDLDRPIIPRQSILYIDPPEHVKYRRLVQPAFTPGRLRKLEVLIRDTTRRLLDAIEPGRPFDFVGAFAAELPILVIADMLGVPGSDHDQILNWA